LRLRDYFSPSASWRVMKLRIPASIMTLQKNDMNVLFAIGMLGMRGIPETRTLFEKSSN